MKKKSLMEKFPPGEFCFLGNKTFPAECNETLIENITIVLMEKSLSTWKSFSLEEYKKCCTHTVLHSEKMLFDFFLKAGLLKNGTGEYEITEEFIEELSKII